MRPARNLHAILFSGREMWYNSGRKFRKAGINLENICYIVGAASLDGVRLSPRAGDYVIAADGGYRSLKARGIEPDFVMGDFDSLGYRPDHPNVETHPVMKDDTDLGLAVRWALAHILKCTFIN